MVISISLQNNVGKVTSAMLPDSFTLDEFTKMLSEKLGDIEGHRFVMDGKQLRLNDEQTFNQQKEQITNGKVIFVLDRLPGGTDTVVHETYISKLMNSITKPLLIELDNIPKRLSECIMCLDDIPCISFCCEDVCSSCFLTYFKKKYLKLKCMNPDCRKTLSYIEFFRTPSFLNLLADLVSKQQFIHNIDGQICRCGAMMINETNYAQQICRHCNRKLCFFCNKDWDDKLMQNTLYTCKNNCDYEMKITYELVPLSKFNTSLTLPNRRCCPKCFIGGAYGGLCKYHKCTNCDYSYCFICLESEEECKRKYKTEKILRYAERCTDTKDVGYEIFPRT